MEKEKRHAGATQEVQWARVTGEVNESSVCEALLNGPDNADLKQKTENIAVNRGKANQSLTDFNGSDLTSH